MAGAVFPTTHHQSLGPASVRCGNCIAARPVLRALIPIINLNRARKAKACVDKGIIPRNFGAPLIDDLQEDLDQSGAKTNHNARVSMARFPKGPGGPAEIAHAAMMRAAKGGKGAGCIIVAFAFLSTAMVFHAFH